MNTIGRRRRRPRVRSVNFRSFFWVLVREAATEVLCLTSLAGERRSWVRGLLVHRNRQQVVAWAFEHLVAYERRRRGEL